MGHIFHLEVRHGLDLWLRGSLSVGIVDNQCDDGSLKSQSRVYDRGLGHGWATLLSLRPVTQDLRLGQCQEVAQAGVCVHDIHQIWEWPRGDLESSRTQGSL